MRKGYLEEPLDGKTIGIVKFVIVDSNNESITNSCAVGYGDNGLSPNLQLKEGRAHIIELINNQFKVKYIHCLIGLQLYRYNFDSFLKGVKFGQGYNFGTYKFRYAYKEDYTSTDFYKQSQKAYRKGKIDSYPDHNLSDGRMTLVDHSGLSNENLHIRYPSYTVEIQEVIRIRPKNLEDID